jgi:opacity protein-like surface antigen
MKKLTLSLTTILAMSTFAVAGGDIAPVEPVVETPMVMEAPANTGFYLGLAYGYEKLKIERAGGGSLVNEKFGSIMVDAGYKFNQYVAVEGRYWSGINSNNDLAWRSGLPADITVDAWGIYLKPMYPVSSAFNIYGLVGYGSADATYDLPNAGSITSDSTDGFSWGIGADYAITNNWSVFVDYTSVIDGESGNTDRIDTDDSLSTVNIGVNYQF